MTGARRHDEDGFTLLELLTVVAILGILMALAIASYTFATERSRRVACLQNQRILASAVQVYRTDHGGTLPPVTDPSNVQQSQTETLDALKPYAKWPTGDFATCTKDGSVHLTVDRGTGDVTCAIHPADE